MVDQKALQEMQQACKSRRITLLLGAGVSMGSGLPSWNTLVQMMYFSALDSRWQREGITAHPGYLFAVAEWQLSRTREPNEITARKIRRYYKDPTEFLDRLKQTLYPPFSSTEGQHLRPPRPRELPGRNGTLAAVADLCRPLNKGEKRRARAVVNYNYDSLLEMVLDEAVKGAYQPVWQPSVAVDLNRVPIYHVHGFVPLNGKGSRPDQVVFTEDQYHAAMHDPYSWSNLVQLQYLTTTIGIMVGMSLSDRNMRRLLDALRHLPGRRTHFAILERPKWPEPSTYEIAAIQESAEKYRREFDLDGSWGARRVEIDPAGLAEEVQDLDERQQTRVLEELGVRVVWYDAHEEVPGILRSLPF